MIEAVRRGLSLRTAARRLGVGKSTVARWVKHAKGRRLDRVDLSSRPSRPIRSCQTPPDVETLILDLRLDLKEHSALGEHGAQAIHRELLAKGLKSPPSVRTIGRVLQRRGALDGRVRTRRPAPPRGWYLPLAASAQEELDSFDLIEDLRIQDGPMVDVLTAISLHGGLAQAWPLAAQVTAKTTLQLLLHHWNACGLPRYAQFDNDTRFQGAHHHCDSISRVMRLCLALKVVPVFAPPRETGFQAAIEQFNRRWQEVVWQRFHHANLSAVCDQSSQFIAAHRQRYAARLDQAPPRRSLPADFALDLQAPPRGTIIYLRRCTAAGDVSLLGHVFHVDDHWPHRLVRCEFDLDAECIRFFALRRREPDCQPLLRETPHRIPNRTFHE